jgi:hypothetical protein
MPLVFVHQADTPDPPLARFIETVMSVHAMPERHQQP